MALSRDPSGPRMARENAKTSTYVAQIIESIVNPRARDKVIAKKDSVSVSSSNLFWSVISPP